MVLIHEWFQRSKSEVVLRGDGPAFAGNLTGDSLRKLAEGTIIDEERRFGLSEHVEEARRNNLPSGIDDSRGRGSFEIANRRDSISANADIADVPGISRAVVDAAILDELIVRCRLIGGRRLYLRYYLAECFADDGLRGVRE